MQGGKNSKFRGCIFSYHVKTFAVFEDCIILVCKLNINIRHPRHCTDTFLHSRRNITWAKKIKLHKNKTKQKLCACQHD